MEVTEGKLPALGNDDRRPVLRFAEMGKQQVKFENLVGLCGAFGAP